MPPIPGELHPGATPPLPVQRLEVIKVRVSCASLEDAGWLIEDPAYEVVPRVGEEILVSIQKKASGVSHATSAFLIVEKVTHFPATVNGWRIVTEPTIVLDAREDTH